MTTTQLLAGDPLPISTRAGLIIAAMGLTFDAIAATSQIARDIKVGYSDPDYNEKCEAAEEMERRASRMRKRAGLAA